MPESVTFHSRGLDDAGLHRTIQNISTPTITVYRPEQPSRHNAAFVICPGGGYGAVVIDREGHAIARYFAQQCLTVAVLKYRLPAPDTFNEGLPASQEDALEALRFMRRHADEWGLDTNRIGIMGFSAGGHLAGSVAAFGGTQDGSRPDFVAMLYPVVVMSGDCLHQGSRENLIGRDPSADRVKEFSLEHRIQTDFPPFFIVHAKDDVIVPCRNSVLLADALQSAGVPVEFLLVSTGGHGFTLGRTPDSSCWKDRFLSWLDRLP